MGPEKFCVTRALRPDEAGIAPTGIKANNILIW